MKLFFTILFFANIGLFAQYTTPNTGVDWNMDSLKLYAPAVVTGTYPDYTVSANIIVSASDKVIVPAGSRLVFTATTAGFEINGTLKIMGTSADSVYMWSQTEDSLGGWVGLLFNDTAVDSACEVHYARIMFATNGFRAINASPKVFNSTFYKNRVGVRFTGSDAVVSDNRIERSYEYGIIMTLTSSPQILNNIIKDNNTQNTSAKNQVSIGLQGNNSPIIKGNTISGNWSIRTGGISLWVSGTGAFSNAIIENNTISNNSFGITLYATSNGVINALVKNNVIYNNNINPDVNVSGSGINVNGTTGNTPVISRNTIYGNWWGITIQNGTTVQAGPSPNIGNLNNSDTTDNGRNYIYNNIQPGGTFDLYNNCTNDIQAQNNDWGVYDSAGIEAHIFHKADNAQHGTVLFMPFYDPSTIPVELVSFSYSVIAGGLSFAWSTATETNNRGFEIALQHKQGESEVLASVAGSGSSTEMRDYSADIVFKNEGSHSFMLRQIDFDGTVNDLKKIEVQLNAFVSGYQLSENYPNPFNPTTEIEFALAKKSDISLKVYDILGKEITTLASGGYEAGRYTVLFDGSNLVSGVYIYKLSYGIGQTITKKMTLLK